MSLNQLSKVLAVPELRRLGSEGESRANLGLKGKNKRKTEVERGGEKREERGRKGKGGEGRGGEEGIFLHKSSVLGHTVLALWEESYALGRLPGIHCLIREKAKVTRTQQSFASYSKAGLMATASTHTCHERQRHQASWRDSTVPRKS